MCWAAYCQVGLCSLAFCPTSTQRDQRHLYAETVTNRKDAGNGAMPWNQKEWFINVTTLWNTFLITNKMGFGNEKPLDPLYRSLYCRLTMKETSNRVKFIFSDKLGEVGGECRIARSLLSVLTLLIHFPGSGMVPQSLTVSQGRLFTTHISLLFVRHQATSAVDNASL
jgi:hypothetical protein